MNNKEKIIQKLINLIINSNIEQIRNYLLRIRSIPFGVSNDERLIKAVINIKSPLIYRSIIYALNTKIDTYDIELKRKKNVKLYINDFNTDLDMFDSYKKVMDEIVDKKTLKNYKVFFSKNDYDYFMLLLENSNTKEFESMKQEFFKNYSYINLCHYVIDYLFNDFYHNIEMNVNEMLNCEIMFNVPLLSDASRSLYRVIKKLNTLSAKDILVLFNKLKDYKIEEMYYDDMRHMRDITYKSLVNNSLNVDVDKRLYNSDLSNKYGVSVYYLNGEDFYAIVRNLSVLRNNIRTQSDIYMCDVNNQIKDGYSFSYISNNNINTFDCPELYVTFLYSNIDYRNIVHVYHSDSYSSYDRVSFRKATSRRNELLTPAGLMNKTVGYNEIVIDNNHSSIKPSALLCPNKITKSDILISKTLKIPIVIINTKKYINNTSMLLSFNILKEMRSDIYIENYKEDVETENFTL